MSKPEVVEPPSRMQYAVRLVRFMRDRRILTPGFLLPEDAVAVVHRVIRKQFGEAPRVTR